MSEKVEWEIVDAPQPQGDTHTSSSATFQQLLQGLLGKWWRWKVIGSVTATGVILVLMATLAGMFALVLAAGAVVAIGVNKLRRWAHGNKHVPATRRHM